MDCGDHLELSGAIYDIPRQSLNDLMAMLNRMSKDKFIEHKDEMSALAIAGHWMKLLAAPVSIPNMVDAATGESLTFITDHYRVNDWAALAARLAAESDVEGDEQDGWNRLQAIKHDMMRSLVAINISERKDRIELFSRSMIAADTQKQWFNDVAGDAVSFLTREISDPLSALGQDSKLQTASQEMPEGIQQKITHEYKQKHYANWADEPLPALGGKTPREAVRSAAGKEQVIKMLKDFEHGEAANDIPFDFSFLWDTLGLKRG